MEPVRVERLDHLGVIAAVIKDVGLLDLSNARLGPDAQEVLTPGEAVAGMILNGLGFANRPLSLTPPFFPNKPLDLLLCEGIEAELFNRFKRGHMLDAAYIYGCDVLFQELALAVCAQDGIDQRFHHLDTTRFSLTGEYVPDSDEHAITITHGYSTDYRPDLKQAGLERMGSQGGSVPCVSKSWQGHTSDLQVFHERAQALMTLALLVYSVTQRRLRQPFAEHHETVPNQIPSTDTVADLAVGLPTVGRHAPCPGDSARSSA
jgi:transposase